MRATVHLQRARLGLTRVRAQPATLGMLELLTEEPVAVTRARRTLCLQAMLALAMRVLQAPSPHRAPRLVSNALLDSGGSQDKDVSHVLLACIRQAGLQCAPTVRQASLLALKVANAMPAVLAGIAKPGKKVVGHVLLERFQ